MHGAAPICLHDVMPYNHKVNLTLPVRITLPFVDPNTFLCMRFCSITKMRLIRNYMEKRGHGFFYSTVL